MRSVVAGCAGCSRWGFGEVNQVRVARRFSSTSIRSMTGEPSDSPRTLIEPPTSRYSPLRYDVGICRRRIATFLSNCTR